MVWEKTDLGKDKANQKNPENDELADWQSKSISRTNRLDKRWHQLAFQYQTEVLTKVVTYISKALDVEKPDTKIMSQRNDGLIANSIDKNTKNQNPDLRSVTDEDLLDQSKELSFPWDKPKFEIITEKVIIDKFYGLLPTANNRDPKINTGNKQRTRDRDKVRGMWKQ